MKTIKFIFIFSFLFFSMNGCSSKQAKSMDQMDMSMVSIEEAPQVSESRIVDYDEDAEYSIMQETAPAPLALSAQTINIKRKIDFITSKAASAENDGDKKFIRTANLSFKVKDIVTATHVLENIVIAKKGFIIQSNINSSDVYENESRISKDSILVISHKNLNGTLTLRVHYTLLDETLREMALVAEEINFRTITAQDVTFDILANTLEQARTKDKAQRVKNISGAGKGHKLEDLLDAENAIDYARQSADNALVQEHRRDDLITFSTITITLQQEPIVTYSMRASEKDVPEYRQGFFSKVGSGIAEGWYDLLDFVADLIAVWPVLLFLGGIVWLIVFFVRGRKKKAKEEK